MKNKRTMLYVMNAVVVALLLVAFVKIIMDAKQARREAFYFNNANVVTVFTDCDYKGGSETYPVGSYLWSASDRVPNDTISSIRVPNGMKVTVYEHGSFTGASKTFTADVPCLTNIFDNTISSLKVEGPVAQPVTEMKEAQGMRPV